MPSTKAEKTTTKTNGGGKKVNGLLVVKRVLIVTSKGW